VQFFFVPPEIVVAGSERLSNLDPGVPRNVVPHDSRAESLDPTTLAASPLLGVERRVRVPTPPFLVGESGVRLAPEIALGPIIGVGRREALGDAVERAGPSLACHEPGGSFRSLGVRFTHPLPDSNPATVFSI